MPNEFGIIRYARTLPPSHPRKLETAFKATFNPGSGTPVTYNCKSSVSRYNLRQYGSVKVLEGLETEKKNLCSA
jgi:hypothetical protein